MNNQFHDIVKFYEKLNNQTAILSDEKIHHQKKRLKDLNLLMNEFDKLAHQLESTDTGIENREKIDEMLLELHTILANFEWHIAQMQDLSMDMFKKSDDAID